MVKIEDFEKMDEQNFYAAPQAEIEAGQGSQWWMGDAMLAGRGQRLAAAIVDGIAVGVPYVPILIFSVMVEIGSIGEAALLGAVLLTACGYLVLMGLNLYWLYDNGQTVGKKLLGIKIVRSDLRTRASLPRIIFLRVIPVWIIANVPCIGSMILLGNYVAIFSGEQRCGHDYVADTHVVVDDGEVGQEEDYRRERNLEWEPERRAGAFEDPSGARRANKEGVADPYGDGGYTTDKGF